MSAMGPRHRRRSTCRMSASRSVQPTKKLPLRFFSGSFVLAGDRGFEPRHTDPESAVLPLDESPVQATIIPKVTRAVNAETGSGSRNVGFLAADYADFAEEVFDGLEAGRRSSNGLRESRDPEAPEQSQARAGGFGGQSSQTSGCVVASRSATAGSWPSLKATGSAPPSAVRTTEMNQFA